MITKVEMSKQLLALCEHLNQTFALISFERKEQLADLAAYIADRIKTAQPINLIVICTHNSRRSHMGQLWLQVAANYYDVEGLHSFSGGTEATAFNPRAVAVLQRAGFPLTKKNEGENPLYYFDFPGIPEDEKTLFSKTYDSPPNPTENFAAILVCTDADEGCPFIPGADARFSIPYDDPKSFDETPEEVQRYNDRVLQIGREFLYAMHMARQFSETRDA